MSPPPETGENKYFRYGSTVCFFVLCNRHWFNKAPGPILEGPRWRLPIYPPLLAQTLAMPIYPYPSIDRPFIVLTETRSSYRHIPVWARYSPHRTRVEAHANTLSP